MSTLAKWIRSKLLYKMVLIYTLLAVVPLAFVSTWFYINATRIVEENTIELSKGKLLETKGKLDLMFNRLTVMLEDVAEQPFLANHLLHALDPVRYPSANPSQVKGIVQDYLQYMFQQMRAETGPYVGAIYLVDALDRVTAIGTDEPIQYPRALKQMPFERKGAAEWAFFVDGGRLVCNLHIENPYTHELLGMVILMLDSDGMADLLGNYQDQQFYITSHTNFILYSNQRDEIGKLLDFAQRANVEALRSESSSGVFRYVSFVSLDEVRKQLKHQSMVAVYVSVIAWLAVIVITFLILKRITQPVSRLTRLMKRVEKEQKYMQIHPIRTTDEIGRLCHGYNRMVIEIESLVDRVYKEELNRKSAELNALRMHFNPHFLYNTLEYISILSQKPDKLHWIPVMIHKLSSILRFAVSSEHLFIPLQQEIDYMRIYTELHVMRLESSVRFVPNVPDSLLQLYVPKLILQPVIENAYVHGFSRRNMDGELIIRAAESGGELLVEVENRVNGRPGGELSGEPAHPGSGTGLKAVQDRIRLHYGAPYGVKLRRHALGAIVSLRLPIQFSD